MSSSEVWPAHVLLVEVLEEDLLPPHDVAVHLEAHHQQAAVVPRHVHRLVKVERQELIAGKAKGLLSPRLGAAVGGVHFEVGLSLLEPAEYENDLVRDVLIFSWTFCFIRTEGTRLKVNRCTYSIFFFKKAVLKIITYQIEYLKHDYMKLVDTFETETP